MRFRHLDYTDDVPASELGPAAIEAVLERGDLADWAPLSRHVTRDPHGELAEVILRLCAANPRYGTSRLWTDYIDHLRRPSAPGTEARTLAELRRNRGLTQAEVGARMGISQSDVSKLERRTDVRVSTLRDYLGALGLTLHISAGEPGDVAAPSEVVLGRGRAHT